MSVRGCFLQIPNLCRVLGGYRIATGKSHARLAKNLFSRGPATQLLASALEKKVRLMITDYGTRPSSRRAHRGNKAMRQQGCVYFIGAMGMQAVKIGFTNSDPKRRLQELQTGNPHTLHLMVVCSGTMGQEKWLHDQFDEYWIRGEWFRLEGRVARVVSTLMEFHDPAFDRLRAMVQVCGGEA